MITNMSLINADDFLEDRFYTARDDYDKASEDLDHWSRVVDCHPYAYTEAGSKTVIANMCQYPLDITIKFKKPGFWRRRWWRIAGYSVGGYTLASKYPDTIFIWDCQQLRASTIPRLHALLAHEIAHLKGYGHGSNKPHGELYDRSVPVQMGRLRDEWSSRYRR